MHRSTCKCHDCGRFMIPRTTYSRGIWGNYYPRTNHCPFCLSNNWHGGSPTLGMRLFWALGVGLGILASVLVGALLFKLQYLAGVEGSSLWLTLMTYTISVAAGYRYYSWFTAWKQTGE